ncbi:hypothetical protein [Actinokineospora globicatena]|uniref:Uncharacterized protein n=1 Tax=Actinokineospora globicatena TaxID=103729 RepID=A0A9W6QV51_9PSEU|nr:hypothetical protein [Actinokineospora globicatena]GLW95440.1 hypothetical protein Aglo03_62560 [Actinokineospora globicatena]
MEQLSSLELLADALREAQAAQARGLIVGSLDEVTLRRAERRARRQDQTARLMSLVPVVA